MPDTIVTEATQSLSLLQGGDEEIKMLDVTRQFDFGQFVELFDITELDGKKIPTPVVIDISGNPGKQAVASSQSGDRLKALSFRTGESAPTAIDLFELVEGRPAEKPGFVIDDASRFAAGGIVIETEGRLYHVTLNERELAALDTGITVEAVGEYTDDNETATLELRLRRAVADVEILPVDLAKLISGEALGGTAQLELTSAQREALLRNGFALVTRKRGNERDPVHLSVVKVEPLLVDTSFKVLDTPSFLARPMVPAADGRMTKVSLTTEAVSSLIAGNVVTVEAGGKTITLQPIGAEDNGESSILDVIPATFDTPIAFLDKMPPGKKFTFLSAYVSKQNDGLIGVDENTGSTAAEPFVPKPIIPWVQMQALPPPTGEVGTGLLDKVGSQPLPETVGLSVAVFVPWRQEWRLKGFSRGNLLNSIALAPSEEVTMEVRSWERQSSTLEQSTEMETETQAETVQSTRDTEDVFKEMLSKSEFTFQASASVDASFDWGIASIQMGGNIDTTDTSSLQNTCRNSRQSLRESTVKASSRVRSRRVTRITQTKEWGKEERVTRSIRNPNPARTLTLDFFETLAHYDITLQFMKERLRLVVLVPNPIRVAKFVEDTVRLNETALRNGLIETALVDGFAGCRMKVAYQKARERLQREQDQAAQNAPKQEQRDKPGLASGPKPWEPQEKAILDSLARILDALKMLKDNDLDAAFKAISTLTGKWGPPTAVSDDVRKKAQRWLFVALCHRQFPNVMTRLAELEKKASLGIEDARSLLSVLPAPDTPVRLTSLVQLPEQQKEELALVGKMKQWDDAKGERMWMNDIDWGVFTARMRTQGLYTPADEGLVSLCEQIPQLFKDLEVKRAAGEAMTDVAVAQAKAEGEQNKATLEDRLQIAFPLEEYAQAEERAEALCRHLNEHLDHYNYALFQALPPAIQLTRIYEASQGSLPIGLFEPRVIGLAGKRLVVPLTPLAGSNALRKFVKKLADDLQTAFTHPDDATASARNPSSTAATEAKELRTDTVVLPTPGVSVATRLGRYDAVEENVMNAMQAEVRRETALARQQESEADRRESLLGKNDLSPFIPADPVLRLAMESSPGQTPVESAADQPA